MLKKLAKRIEKHVRMAEDYEEQAMLIRHDDNTVFETFISLANDEINHAEKLLKEGQRIIESKRLKMYHEDQTHTVDYEKCKVMWDWEYRTASDRLTELRYKLSLVRR